MFDLSAVACQNKLGQLCWRYHFGESERNISTTSGQIDTEIGADI